MTKEEVLEALKASGTHKRFLKKQALDKKKRESAQRIANACGITSTWEERFGSQEILNTSPLQEVDTPNTQEIQKTQEKEEEERETLCIRPCADIYNPYTYL